MRLLTNTLAFIKKHAIPLLFLSATAVFEYMHYFAGVGDFAQTLGIRVVLYLFTALAIIFPKESYAALFKALVIIATFSCSIAIIVFSFCDAASLDRLSYEDDLVENLSAIYLFLASALFLVYAVVQIIKRHFVVFGLALLAAALFFVIGMEEISWMQRIVDRESSQFFLTNNIQGETNLHNLNTNLSERLYYIGGAILLVAVPLFRDKIASVFKKIRLSAAVDFLPSRWLLLPFSVIFGFTPVLVYGTPGYLCALVLVAAALMFMMYELYKMKKFGQTALYVCAMIILLVSIAISVRFSIVYAYDTIAAHGIRSWALAEYREMLLAFGIFVYAVDFIARKLSPGKPSRKRSR